MMRVSKDPDDKAYSPTADQRRAWCNDQEILNWVTADEFRRCVITAEKVHNGSVRIERLPEDSPQPSKVVVEVELPADVGFAGAGLVFEKPLKAEPEPESESESESTQIELLTDPVTVSGQAIECPGDPDEEIEVTPSERLPDGTTQI